MAAEQVIRVKSNDDDLICPITCELFRDPVIAEDGHVYERVAITRWILEHETSPFTRQPITVYGLRPDIERKRLANQRSNSTVSFNIENNTITLPPRIRMPRGAQVAPEQNMNAIQTQPNSCTCNITIIITIICIIIYVSIPLIVIFAASSSLS